MDWIAIGSVLIGMSIGGAIIAPYSILIGIHMGNALYRDVVEPEVVCSLLF